MLQIGWMKIPIFPKTGAQNPRVTNDMLCPKEGKEEISQGNKKWKYLYENGRIFENKVEVSFKQDSDSIGEVALFSSDGLGRKQQVRHGPVRSGPAKKTDYKKGYPQARIGGTRQEVVLHVGHSEIGSKGAVENVVPVHSVKTQVGSVNNFLVVGQEEVSNSERGKLVGTNQKKNLHQL